MLAGYQVCVVFSQPKSKWKLTGSVKSSSQMVSSASSATMCLGELKERIREMLLKVEITPSSYDTAWVAMVPSLKSSKLPRFPQCVDWLLENQLDDGSWGISCDHPLLKKDSLTSTLACVLALRKWNIGREHVERGVHFIRCNFPFAFDDSQCTPVGFNVIFPGMIQYTENLGLNLSLDPNLVDAMLHERNMEFQRNCGNRRGKIYLAYIAEGLGNIQDWGELIKYKRKNGSFFNSPSTTAAVLTHLEDAQCQKYLEMLLKKFGNAVPTSYPLGKFIQLNRIEDLEKLGIARHFRNEIRSILDELYRCWLQYDDELYLDASTRAMTFRLLRMNGYDVSADAISQFSVEEDIFDSLGLLIMDKYIVLELYKASQIMTCPKEVDLQKLNSWSSHFLQEELSKAAMHVDRSQNNIQKEVDYALKFPYHTNLERLYHRRNIEHYDVHNFHILKSSYKFSSIFYSDILELAVQDFGNCQAIHQEELNYLNRWVIENHLDQLNFARQKLAYCYFSAAATLFSPDLSEARMSWAKNGVLTTVVDDFYDCGDSREELYSLIQLVENWDGDLSDGYCSENVKVIFSAIYNTVNEFCTKAYELQGRDVSHHIIEIWLNLLNSMMKETEWVLNKSVPTLDEYMSNAYTSFALGPIVLPALYLVGPMLQEELIRSSEYHTLFKHMSTCGRLLNDIQGFQREQGEGKLNGVALRMAHASGSLSIEEAINEMRVLINNSRIELLGMVLRTNGSLIPRECKDLFWKMCRVVHVFYQRNDGFTSPEEMVGAINAVLKEPLKVGILL